MSLSPLATDDALPPADSYRIVERVLMPHNDDVTAALAEWARLVRRPAWWAFASCRGAGTEPWFPERGQPPTAALDICRTCQARTECGAAGADEVHGIWGGTTGADRRKARSAARVARQATRRPGP